MRFFQVQAVPLQFIGATVSVPLQECGYTTSISDLGGKKPGKCNFKKETTIRGRKHKSVLLIQQALLIHR